MKKDYIIKFYKQRNGQKTKELTNCEIDLTNMRSKFTNKDAYNMGREKIRKWAINDLESIDDRNSRDYENLKDSIKQLKKGKINNYYYDTCTYFFKVFSKKIK